MIWLARLALEFDKGEAFHIHSLEFILDIVQQVPRPTSDLPIERLPVSIWPP